jgi:hypothetical protein
VVGIGRCERARLGYRTLTVERANVSMVMHGPRAALQLLF